MPILMPVKPVSQTTTVLPVNSQTNPSILHDLLVLFLSMQTMTLNNHLTLLPHVHPLGEEGEVSEEPSSAEQEPDHVTSEDQNSWETVRGVRSYRGWNQVPELCLFTG